MTNDPSVITDNKKVKFSRIRPWTRCVPCDQLLHVPGGGVEGGVARVPGALVQVLEVRGGGVLAWGEGGGGGVEHGPGGGDRFLPVACRNIGR